MVPAPRGKASKIITATTPGRSVARDVVPPVGSLGFGGEKKLEMVELSLKRPGQRAVDSGQWAGGSRQGAVGSRQGAVGSGQWTVGSRQGAVGRGQWAGGSSRGQGAVGSGQWAAGSG